MSSDALLTDLRDVTHVAVLLEAEAERVAPEVRLVVVRTARVEAEIAADRAHVAKLRTRDRAGRQGQRLRMLAYERVARETGQRFGRADHQLPLFNPHAVQLGYLLQ